MSTTPRELSHAEQNASGHAETIEAYAEAVAFCREHREAPEEARELSREARAAMHEHGWTGDNKEDTAEAIEGAARDQALSVEFRCDGWTNSPADMEPDQYRILLSTGGPALQIAGSFDPINGATSVRLEHQDWGTPWTEFDGIDEDALAWFVDLFCLGSC
jgi:hypothetical protein